MEDKKFPHYDDSAHIDSAAINESRKQQEDYTMQYIDPMQMPNSQTKSKGKGTNHTGIN